MDTTFRPTGYLLLRRRDDGGEVEGREKVLIGHELRHRLIRKSIAGSAAAAILLASLSNLSGAQTTPAVVNDYLRAENLVRGHRWDEGLAALQSLLADDPNNLKALNLTALAYIGKGDPESANRYLERALAVDPKFVPALKNLAIDEFNAKQTAAAEKHLLSALNEAPDDPVINLYLGQLSCGQANYRRAADSLSKAGPFLASNPNLAACLAASYLAVEEQAKALDMLDALPPAELNPDMQFILGSKLSAAGRFDRAVPYLQAARASHPESYDASFDLAWSYISLKQYSQAIEVIRAAIAAGQDSAELEDVLGEAYEGGKQTQPAIDALRRAIALAPEEEDSYLDFASICIDHQDFPAALKVLQVGLQIHPKSDQLLFERGIFYAMQDNFALAEKDFEQAASLAPEKDASYAGLGVLYLESGNAAQAVQTLKQRLQEKPGDSNLWYLLGEALLRSGAHAGEPSFAEAQAALERSIKITPQLCLPHVSLGKIYLEEDRVEDAVIQLEQARSIDPKEKSTYWQLAVAYRKLGQTEKQKQALNTLKELGEEERNGSRDKEQPGNGAAAASIAEPR
jgi:tetratricopeptide (TPR) repeat protein